MHLITDRNIYFSKIFQQEVVHLRVVFFERLPAVDGVVNAVWRFGIAVAVEEGLNGFGEIRPQEVINKAPQKFYVKLLGCSSS